MKKLKNLNPKVLLNRKKNQFDPLSPTSVAEWYRSIIIERGYSVDFNLDDMKLVDKYIEDVLWKMDQSNESFFKERCAFDAYIGETIVRNFEAGWVGGFDLYSYAANYYSSFIRFNDGWEVTPARMTYRVHNKSNELVEENVNNLLVKYK